MISAKFALSVCCFLWLYIGYTNILKLCSYQLIKEKNWNVLIDQIFLLSLSILLTASPFSFWSCSFSSLFSLRSLFTLSRNALVFFSCLARAILFNTSFILCDLTWFLRLTTLFPSICRQDRTPIFYNHKVKKCSYPPLIHNETTLSYMPKCWIREQSHLKCRISTSTFP